MEHKNEDIVREDPPKKEEVIEVTKVFTIVVVLNRRPRNVQRVVESVPLVAINVTAFLFHNCLNFDQNIIEVIYSRLQY